MSNTKRVDLLKQKEEHLISRIDITLSLLDSSQKAINADKIYNQLVNDASIQITSPEEPPMMMGFIVTSSLGNYSSGYSIKPGNIIVNLRNLIKSIPVIVESAFGIVTENYLLKVCAALAIWCELRDIATVEISREQAAVMIALWQNCNERHKINTDKGYSCVNLLLCRYGLPEMNLLEYHRMLDQLVNLGCIEIEEDTIWLREWISRKYT